MDCMIVGSRPGNALRRLPAAAALCALACIAAPAAWAQGTGAPGLPLAGMEFGVREMFMQSHIVVKAVVAFLALSSLVTWMILIEKALVFSNARRANARFLADFRRHAQAGELPPADGTSTMGRMWQAALAEIERFKAANVPASAQHPERLLQRLALRAGVVQDEELARFGTLMGVLATIGSTSPFTRLFGTVWGILNSFAHIAVARSTNLSVVAPGIAEALLATAIGLFAAIPAVMIYNKFARDINGFVSALDNFSAELVTVVSHRIDTKGMS